MKIEQLSKPVPIRVNDYVVGYSIFKVVDRRPGSTPKLQEIYATVSKDALRTKRELVLSRFRDDMARQYPIHIHESVLASIQTLDEVGTGRPIDILKISRR